MKSTFFLILSFGLFIIAPHIGLAQDNENDNMGESLALLWEQIEAQPDDVGIGCIPLYNPGSRVLYNANVRYPLASVTKLLIFIEYARRLDTYQISLSEMVDVATLDRYNLPRTDRGAHDRFMAQYPEGIQQISLWDVAEGMVQYSSNAASDYLLDMLEPVDWDGLYRRLGLGSTDFPHSLTMIPLLMSNHETGNAGMNDVESLTREQGESLLDLYLEDEGWRQAEIAYREQGGRRFPSWEVQTAVLEQVTANGTVNDFLNLLRILYTDDLALPESVKSLVRRALRWTESEYINREYVEYGSKLGFYSGGTLALIAYGHAYDGYPTISAVFFRNVPRDMYSDLVREDAIGDFAHWMNFNGCQGLSQQLAAL